ncbi:hypothetical protein FQN54_000071 [Arachnomyces sp. PD_36]|nr:hypothetical protein FQN54_000071 [Arachnomyces sp. PD_36]
MTCPPPRKLVPTTTYGTAIIPPTDTDTIPDDGGTNVAGGSEIEIEIGSEGESDYGSDFTPDEEELLNALLVKVGSGSGSGSGAGIGTGVGEEEEKENERVRRSRSTGPGPGPGVGGGFPAGTDTGTGFNTAAAGDITSGLERDGARAVSVPVSVPGVSAGVRDIEDYDSVWRGGSNGAKVLGRGVQVGWGQVSQQQKQQGQWGVGNAAAAAAVEHPDLIEARSKEKEGNPAAVPNNGGGEENTYVPDTRSPIERFRQPPMKALSVTDLISPAWCELQYWYSLTKHGRKRRTAAMKQGSVVHKSLEDQVHTTVPVEVTTKEDAWGLRIWNVIQGLRTLRETGMTRELEIWGVIDGEIVNGVIDQLSYECPDPEMEASVEEHYKNAMATRRALPEYQSSITDYLLSPTRGGRRISDIAESNNNNTETAATTGDSRQKKLSERKIYMTDIKTRGAASRSIPTISSPSFRPTQLQLHIYYHLLNRLATTDEITIETLASRYDLNPNLPFSESFISEVGGLNDQFFDVLSSQGSGGGGSTQQSSSSPSSYPATSQDSTSILLSHNTLSTLWSLMKTHLYLTFLPQEQEQQQKQKPTPSPPPTKSQPQPQPFKPPTLLSPLLTATYITPTPTTPTPLGSLSFLFDPAVLTSHLRDVMGWWLGKRPVRGVEVMEAWKCRICEFRDECTWREEREEEMAESRRVRREALGRK